MEEIICWETVILLWRLDMRQEEKGWKIKSVRITKRGPKLPSGHGNVGPGAAVEVLF